MDQYAYPNTNTGNDSGSSAKTNAVFQYDGEVWTRTSDGQQVHTSNS